MPVISGPSTVDHAEAHGGGPITVTDTHGMNLFSSVRSGGSQNDGVLAISVLNESSNPLRVWCDGFQGTAAHTADEWVNLPAGKSMTFEVDQAHNTSMQIDELLVWACAGDAIVSWGVCRRR